MKPTFVIAAACAALLVGSGVANAQNPPTSSANAGTADTPTSADKGKGNNLDTTSKSPRVDPTTAPATTGQDKSAGNNLVAPNGTANGGVKPADASRHPDFRTLDTKNKGTVSEDDVKSNQWLRKNFSRCDTDHDGTLDRTEYNACK
jgi:hypothetical protein